ncbi:MAG: tRNA pseudouridine(55) synthase TruB [Patescibacteria group bacterium]|jgi:tRNA pseudouridine55 synthase
MPFLLIDKPAGITSHDVVDKVRKITGERTVGHAGTLDPFATGLLIVGVGRDCTKQLSTYLGMDKEYEAEFVIGATTDTLDPEGAVIPSPAVSIDQQMILDAMKKLTGEISQIPPMHSAIKVGGQKLYNLARQGKTIEVAPRQLTVHSFELLGEPNLTTWPVMIKVRIFCSSGTYIRALARDLGILLGTTGYVSSLRRTKIGEFSVTSAKTLGELTSPVLPS